MAAWLDIRYRWVLTTAMGLAVLGLMAVPAWSDEPTAQERNGQQQEKDAAGRDSSTTDEGGAVGIEQIKQWIVQLDAPEFSQRQEAALALRRVGSRAFDLLVEAAGGDSRERSMRAIQVLEYHFLNGEPAAKKAAKEALEKIVSSGNQRAAKRAEAILKPETHAAQQPPVAARQQAQIILGRMRAFPANGAARAVRITTDANGVRTTSVSEKDRKIKLVESPRGDLTLTVTITKNGKPQVKVYQAKSPEDLKKKDAGAYKIYQEVKGMGKVGQIQIQIGGFPGVPMVPAMKPAVPAQLKPLAEKLRRSIDALEKARPDDEKARSQAIAELRALQRRL